MMVYQIKQTFSIDLCINKANNSTRSAVAYPSFFSIPIILGGQNGSKFVRSSFQGKKPNWNRYFTTMMAFKRNDIYIL